MTTPLRYLHVDVFAPRPYGGNSLPIFPDAAGLSTLQMQTITRELRHFEAIFLTPTAASQTFQARVFDLFEELPFAGHPIVGAAAALHHAQREAHARIWTFELPERSVCVTTVRVRGSFTAVLDQGEARIGGERENRAEIAAAFGLGEDDLDPALPVEVVSTGLCYLIVPVLPDALGRARIRADITPLVREAGAQFAVLLDESGREVRHWNNDGILEDVATGSAAGTVGAYRLRHCGAPPGERFTLHQGRFAGRPSQIEVEPHGTRDAIHSVKVGGSVAIVGHGVLEALP